jgi:hypothetical protein
MGVQELGDSNGETRAQALVQTWLRESENLVRKVHSNFDLKEIDSPLVEEAENLFAKLRNHHQIPRDCCGVLDEALQNSWYALWKAKNYSVSGWMARIERDYPSVPEAHLRAIERELVRNSEVDESSVRWLFSHCPPFDLSGKEVSIAPRSFDNAIKNVFSNARIPISYLAEGAILKSEDALQHLGNGLSIAYGAIFCNLPPKLLRAEGLQKCIISTGSHYTSGFHCIKSSTVKLGTTVRFQRGRVAYDGFEGSVFFDGLSLEDVSVSAGSNRDQAFLKDARVYGQLTLRPASDSGNLEFGESRRFSRLSIELGKDSRFDIKIQPSANHEDRLSLCMASLGGRKVFSGKISAPHVKFSKLLLRVIEFPELVNFEEIDVSESCTLFECVFKTQFDCTNSLFGSGQSDSVVFDMRNCVFQASQDPAKRLGFLPNFADSVFNGTALFLNSRFLFRSSFSGVAFKSSADFGGSTFEGYTEFKSSESNPTVFFGPADFSLPVLSDMSSFGSVTFKDATFNDRVDFSNRIFGNFTEFGAVKFNEAPKFHGSTFHQNVSFRNARFDWRQSRPLRPSGLLIAGRFRIWLSKTKHLFLRLFQQTKSRYTLPESIEIHNQYCKNATSSFRTLRQAMQGNDDARQAAIFHREELRARHSRFGDKEVSRFEVWVGGAFSILSDYGESILRPIAIMLVSVLLSASALSGLSGGGTKFFGPALGNAVEIQFRPFYHLNPTFGRAEAMGANDPCSSAINLALHSESAHNLSTYCFSILALRKNETGFKLIVIAHSLITLVCLFLVLLAVRRKLQM